MAENPAGEKEPVKRWHAILLGGFFAALLTNLPLLSAGNFCCCMWIVGGGALAAYLTWRSEKAGMGASYGGLVGFLSGLAGIPFEMFFRYITWDPEKMQGAISKAFERVPIEFKEQVEPILSRIGSPARAMIIGGFAFFLLASIFSTAGGAIVGAWKSEKLCS